MGRQIIEAREGEDIDVTECETIEVHYVVEQQAWPLWEVGVLFGVLWIGFFCIWMAWMFFLRWYQEAGLRSRRAERAPRNREGARSPRRER